MQERITKRGKKETQIVSWVTSEPVQKLLKIAQERKEYTKTVIEEAILDYVKKHEKKNGGGK